jgi:hypothetical protein
MADKPKTDITADEARLAALVLQIADREERITGNPPTRTEVLLVDAGFGLSTVSRLTGKTYEAVKAAARRARTKTGPR